MSFSASRPISDVTELVVTGPAAANVKSLDDLVPVGLHIRQSSSYFEHLSRLNEQRIEAHKLPIPIDPADERLEHYDLLEMVNAGIIPAIMVDSHKAELWAQVFKDNQHASRTPTVNSLLKKGLIVGARSRSRNVAAKTFSYNRAHEIIFMIHG